MITQLACKSLILYIFCEEEYLKADTCIVLVDWR